MVNSVDIILLRHGMTKENEESRYIGWTDSPLSVNGRKEVELVSRNIFQVAASSRIYTSDLVRTIETAHILFPNHQTFEIKQLREMNFGKWECLTYNDLKNDSEYQTWLDQLFTYKLPQGESADIFTERIDQAFDEIKKDIIREQLEEVILVVHGGVIRHLLTKLTRGNKGFFDWKIPYSRGYRLTFTCDNFKEGMPCTSLQVVPTMGS